MSVFFENSKLPKKKKGEKFATGVDPCDSLPGTDFTLQIAGRGALSRCLRSFCSSCHHQYLLLERREDFFDEDFGCENIGKRVEDSQSGTIVGEKSEFVAGCSLA